VLNPMQLQPASWSQPLVLWEKWRRGVDARRRFGGPSRPRLRVHDGRHVHGTLGRMLHGHWALTVPPLRHIDLPAHPRPPPPPPMPHSHLQRVCMHLRSLCVPSTAHPSTRVLNAFTVALCSARQSQTQQWQYDAWGSVEKSGAAPAAQSGVCKHSARCAPPRRYMLLSRLGG
jgi:hypothetical protein